MAATEFSPFGIGIYTVPEAARISGVSSGRLRRWLRGYEYTDDAGQRRQSPALWARELPPVEDGQLVLSFRDLIEAQWVSFFRDQRVSWRMLREVGARIAGEMGVTHPFSTGRFAAVVKGRRSRPGAEIVELLPGKMKQVLTNQRLIKGAMQPFVRQLEFRRDRPWRWFPLEGSRRILVDPRVRFGTPVVASGVPTEILWRNHTYGRASYRALAHWWDVPEAEVRDAVRWEDALRAA